MSATLDGPGVTAVHPAAEQSRLVATSRHRIAVVGAGPAGLFAAERLAMAGHAVTVYDRMPSPARKLLMAGRGGLNLTHGVAMPAFLERYGTDRALVEPAIQAFPPAALLAWCHDLGIETFAGTSGRYFPVGLKASPLVRAWLARLGDLGVRLAVRHHWTGWNTDGTLAFATPDGPIAVAADATLLAVGGASWPRLGSDGGWTRPLADAGVALAPFQPSNAGALVAWSPLFRERFEGQPIKRVAVSLGGKRARGEMVVTAGGLEGGALYAIAGQIRLAGPTSANPVTIAIDLKPDSTVEALAGVLAVPFAKQSLTNVLRKRCGLSPVAIGLLREAAGAALPRAPVDLARLIKGCAIPVSGLAGLERAISTAGGIRAEALDAHFMLRVRPGVFAAGEMLDWDAPTGGFLLQACFATGRAAADGILHWLSAQASERLPGDVETASARPVSSG